MPCNRIPIVFSFDKKFYVPALVAVRSLLQCANKTTFYDIFMFIDDSVDKDLQDEFRKKLDKFENKNINFITMDEKYFSEVPTNKTWSKSVYYRILIPSVISKYDKIIYSDVDVLFKKDMTELFQTDIEDYYWAGVLAEKNGEAVCHQNFAENKNEYIYMTGFMLINAKRMREENIVSKCFETIENFSKRLKMFDLEVLNLTCDKIKALPFEYCVLENIYNLFDKAPEFSWLTKTCYSPEDLNNARSNPAIIHYAGCATKIWNRTRSEISEEYLNVLDTIQFKCNCLQIGDSDLVGKKFNGHDLHYYLQERGLESNHLVAEKLSKDKTTYKMPIDKDSKELMSDILSSDLFLDSDIVHMHLIHNTAFDINYLPIISNLKPTVITLHDPFFLNGHCIHHFECEKWKNFCYDCQKLEIPFCRFCDTTALEFYTKKNVIQNSNMAVIVASKWMENKVKQSPIWKNKKVYRLPFGINQNIYKPGDKKLIRKDLGIPQDATVLMFRSDKVIFKGLDLIKDALKKLKIDQKIVLLTVSEKGLIKDLKNKYMVKEYGWVKDENKLAKLYQASDLFLMPSSQETFGLMAIEAMSCALPVLSITGTALEEVINAPKCGISVSKENFATELYNLINNPDEIKIRSDKSLKFAQENYSKDIYINNLIEIYKDIILNHNTTAEARLVYEQMNKYAKNREFKKRIYCANNPIWRILYKYTYRIYLKLRYGKNVVRIKYDKRYL